MRNISDVEISHFKHLIVVINLTCVGHVACGHNLFPEARNDNSTSLLCPRHNVTKSARAHDRDIRQYGID